MKKDYDLEKMKEIKNPYPKRKKKLIGINLSQEVIDYFKTLAEEAEIPYQKLIDLYLLDCVRNKKKPAIKWVA
ncbi:MAG: CopG family antitoxin [Proteobacteria bacterium]|nr:CopG family antitoxin [Pseudomonadota bacterium]